MPGFNELCQQIEGEYKALGHSLGWRFLYCSKELLNQNPQVALITLNPGGDFEPEGHGQGSCENGSAYKVEQWTHRGKLYSKGEAPLQLQVCWMFESLGIPLESVLAGAFVPFRSPDWKSLPCKKESQQFAKVLWRRVLQDVSPRLILTVDTVTYSFLKSQFGRPMGNPWVEPAYFPGGVLCHEAEIYKNCALVRLNHLSRFPAFSFPADYRHDHTVSFIRRAWKTAS